MEEQYWLIGTESTQCKQKTEDWKKTSKGNQWAEDILYVTSSIIYGISAFSWT